LEDKLVALLLLDSELCYWFLFKLIDFFFEMACMLSSFFLYIIVVRDYSKKQKNWFDYYNSDFDLLGKNKLS